MVESYTESLSVARGETDRATIAEKPLISAASCRASQSRCQPVLCKSTHV
jgi:hypothetical protein